MKKIILFLILFSTVWLNSKTFIREYTYNASEADSKITSRAIALEQVKRLLLEELGVYVHSTLQSEEIETSGEVKELTAKQIEIISAGITETKILEETWNGEIYYIKAEITADENDVIKRLDEIIADKEKTKQLEDSHRRTEVALSEIERLKQQLTQTRDENEKLKIQNKYNQSSNQLSAEDWFQKGNIAYEIGDYKNAIYYCKKSNEIKPFSLNYILIGLIYYLQGNYDLSIAWYQKAIEIDSDDAVAYFIMGLTYRDKGDYDKEIECYQKAIEIKPDHAEAYYSMGIAYHRDNNYVKAIEYYQEAIKNNPDYAEAYYGMGGIAYHNEDNYDKAIEYYQEAIKINPNYVEAYRSMGNIYRNKSINDKAIACYQKAIEINPDDADTYIKMGVAYYNKGNIDEAIKCFQKAIEKNPDLADAYFNMGFVYGSKGYYDKEIECYQRAIEINPDYAEAYYNMGYAYAKKGNFDKSVDCAQQAARLGDKNAQDYLRKKGISW